MKKRSQFAIWAETMVIMIALAILLGLLSAAIGLVALIVGAIVPFLSPVLYLLGIVSGFLSGLACALLIVGLWQPIGAVLDVWRIEGAISSAKSGQWTRRWYSNGWGKWGVGLDLAGFALDLYTVGGR